MTTTETKKPDASDSLNLLVRETKAAFGLRQQGKLGYVGKMLAEHKSFRWIAATMNWEADTLKKHWLMEMESL